MNTQRDSTNREFGEKVRRGMFNPIARHLTNEMTAEDRFQDALCATWWLYRRKAEQGEILDDALLVFAARRFACNLNRSFVGAGGRKCVNQDVLDPRAYRDGRVELVEFHESYLSVGLAEMAAADPQDKLNSALDLEAWVRNLTEPDRAIMAGKLAGECTRKIASKSRRTYKEIWNREKALGRELAERADISIDSSRERRGKWKRTDVSANR